MVCPLAILMFYLLSFGVLIQRIKGCWLFFTTLLPTLKTVQVGIGLGYSLTFLLIILGNLLF